MGNRLRQTQRPVWTHAEAARGMPQVSRCNAHPPMVVRAALHGLACDAFAGSRVLASAVDRMVDVLRNPGLRAVPAATALPANGASIAVSAVRPSALRRALLAACCAPLALLAGCPDAATGPVQAKTTAQQTAPAIGGARGAAVNAGQTPNQPATPAGNGPAASAQDTVLAQQQARRVQALAQQVDKSYTSGVQNYRSGRLDAARLDFDFAVDLMLTSGIDIKNDATLNDEFERTVNAVNSLEMDALKQGNGFSPKTEETPVEAVGDLTFPADAALVARLNSELNTTSDLPLVINETVAGYINAYANSSAFKAHMRRSLERAGKFRPYIQQVLKEEGVPQDLIYLAVAESGFQLQVVNPSGAAGMWQFMPFQGAYGLARNGYFDERFDPEKSTRAYGRYMKSLYKQFGDWYLAMAAYNWGPGNVQKAVMRTGYADFWELYRRNAMPRETKNYVPQILAAILMAKNPAKYGLEGVMADAPLVTDTVGVDYAMDLRLAADVSDTTLATIVQLNPALLRLSTPAGIHYDLHLPQGTKAQFDERIAAIPVEKRASWRFHEVRTGETLEQVSQLFHVSGHDIRVANDLDDTDPVGAGDDLVIPVYSAGQPSTRPLQYTARAGDTLVTIADRFNVSTGELREWNHLDAADSGVGTGDTLYVSEPVRLPPAGRGHARASRRGRSYAVRGRRGAAMRGGRGRAVASRGGSAARGGRGAANSRISTGRGVHGGNARTGRAAGAGSGRSASGRAAGASHARSSGSHAAAGARKKRR